MISYCLTSKITIQKNIAVKVIKPLTNSFFAISKVFLTKNKTPDFLVGSFFHLFTPIRIKSSLTIAKFIVHLQNLWYN